jgi:very-short-patch-repair endonuclease
MALAYPGAALALHSAALGHSLPLWRPLPADVALNVPWSQWNGSRPGVVLHRMTVPESDIVPGRVPMTSVARTCIDVARLMSPADGLAAADAALRLGLTTAAELHLVADTCIDRRGSRGAQIVVAHCDPRRESPAESGSWIYFLRHRLPLPEMQVEITTGFGLQIARVDFLWRNARLVGECDGRMKYTSADDLYREKRREDEVRGEGFDVVRWGPRDLGNDDLARRLRRFLT